MGSESAPTVRESGAADLVARLLQALLAADRERAERVIDDALSWLADGIAVLDDVLAPVMREVGRRWEAQEITVADEHRATAIAHAVLGRIYPHLVSATPRSRGVVLLAGADGEQHMLGLRMVADVLEGAGFDVRNVGAALTPAALTAVVRRHRPRLLGLADTIGDGTGLQRCMAAAWAVDPSLPMLLGGAGVLPTAGDPRVHVCPSARAALDAATWLGSG